MIEERDSEAEKSVCKTHIAVNVLDGQGNMSEAHWFRMFSRRDSARGACVDDRQNLQRDLLEG